MKKQVIMLLAFILLLNLVYASVFNLKIEIPKTYGEVLAGDNIWFTSKIINLANQERIDITLKYEILNSKREIISAKSETVAIETQASFVGNVKIPSDAKKGQYFLQVTVIAPGGETQAETTFNVIKQPKRFQIVIKFSLFDIDVIIPDDYKIVSPGDELLSSIKLVNIGSEGRVDVFLDYEIRDSKERVILKKKETVAVETQANFVRIFDIPEDLPQGEYNLYAKITYADGKIAESGAFFKVKNKRNYKVLIFVLGGFIILSGLVYLGIKSKLIIEKIKMKRKIHHLVKDH